MYVCDEIDGDKLFEVTGFTMIDVLFGMRKGFI